MSPIGRPSVRVAQLLAAALWSTGCVERFLVIDSNPSGAHVLVDGDDVGVAPVELPFTYYGTRRIDGWLPEQPLGTPTAAPAVTQFVELDAPWYQLFPLDLVSELLDPFTHVDRHVVRLDFGPPAVATTHAELLLDADELRRETR